MAIWLVMVPEGRGIFPQLTIEENLAMGAYTRKDHHEVRQDRHLVEKELSTPLGSTELGTQNL